MANARCQLLGAETFEGRGLSFKKNESRVISNDADIAYLRAQPEFSVVDLEEVKVKAKKAKAVAEEPEDDDGDDGDDDEGDTERAGGHTKESLEKMTKSELTALATEEPFNLKLDPDMKKSEMIDAMIAAVNG